LRPNGFQRDTDFLYALANQYLPLVTGVIIVGDIRIINPNVQFLPNGRRRGKIKLKGRKTLPIAWNIEYLNARIFCRFQVGEKSMMAFAGYALCQFESVVAFPHQSIHLRFIFEVDNHCA